VYLPLSREADPVPGGIELSVLEGQFYQELRKSCAANLFLTINLKLSDLSERTLIKEMIRVRREGQISQGDFEFETL